MSQFKTASQWAVSIGDKASPTNKLLTDILNSNSGFNNPDVQVFAAYMVAIMDSNKTIAKIEPFIADLNNLSVDPNVCYIGQTQITRIISNAPWSIDLKDVDNNTVLYRSGSSDTDYSNGIMNYAFCFGCTLTNVLAAIFGYKVTLV